MSKTAVSYKMDSDVVQALKDLSKAYGITETAIVESAIKKEVERIKKEHKPVF